MIGAIWKDGLEPQICLGGHSGVGDQPGSEAEEVEALLQTLRAPRDRRLHPLTLPLPDLTERSHHGSYLIPPHGWAVPCLCLALSWALLASQGL